MANAHIDWDMLGPLLQCPRCAENALTYRDTSVRCDACNASYPIEDRIIVFSQSTEIPRFYSNRLYRHFVDHLKDIHQAHYAAGSSSEWLENRMKADIFKLLPQSTGDVCVDLGCGFGGEFHRLQQSSHVVGVDSQLALLRETRRRHPTASLICADLSALPFRTGTLERVVAIAVLEHVFHLEATLEHVQRALSATGSFHVLVPTEGGLAVALARLITSRRNAKILGLTAQECAIAQRLDHCNTVFAVDNALRKFFLTETTSFWPLRIGGPHLNLSKSYRLKVLAVQD